MSKTFCTFVLYKTEKVMKKIYIEFKEDYTDSRIDVSVNVYIDGNLRVEGFDLYSYVHWAEIIGERCTVYTTNQSFIDRNDLPEVNHILPEPIEFKIIIEKNGERIIDKLKISQKEFWEKLFNTEIVLTWS